jgi:hypothetical protein
MRGGEFEGKTAGARTSATEGLALPSRALTALTTSALALPGLHCRPRGLADRAGGDPSAFLLSRTISISQEAPGGLASDTKS